MPPNPIVRIVGVGQTAVGKLKVDSPKLALESMALALANASMPLSGIDALVATPSMSAPHIMQAHFLATVSGLLNANPNALLRTIDTGGAGPITALGTALDMIRNGPVRTVALVSTDAVGSLPSAEFAARAKWANPDSDLPDPHIPNGYDRYAQWHMSRYGLTREQLAMVTVLMSAMAARHPGAMCKKPYTLEEVLQARQIAPVTSLCECARRADGAVTLIVSREDHYKAHFCANESGLRADKPVILSVAEASGPLYPPPMDKITPDLFSCHRAARAAYELAGLSVKDIDFFGLYDCFPICFIRAVEAVGLCAEGDGGNFVEAAYQRMLKNGGVVDPKDFPINTHGGLMCFGAPWEVPAMYNVTEAIAQLSGGAGARQVHPVPRRALVYGNGGILSASSVAILDGTSGA